MLTLFWQPEQPVRARHHRTRGENCKPSGFLVARLGRPVTAKKRREGVRWCARRGRRSAAAGLFCPSLSLGCLPECLFTQISSQLSSPIRPSARLAPWPLVVWRSVSCRPLPSLTLSRTSTTKERAATFHVCRAVMYCEYVCDRYTNNAGSVPCLHSRLGRRGSVRCECERQGHGERNRHRRQ